MDIGLRVVPSGSNAAGDHPQSANRLVIRRLARAEERRKLWDAWTGSGYTLERPEKFLIEICKERASSSRKVSLRLIRRRFRQRTRSASMRRQWGTAPGNPPSMPAEATPANPLLAGRAASFPLSLEICSWCIAASIWIPRPDKERPVRHVHTAAGENPPARNNVGQPCK